MSEPLLKALETLRGDIGSLREDINSGRAEGIALHLATNRQLDGLSEILIDINERVAKLENRKPPATGVRTAITGVAGLARSALLG
jgi:hypothetical protein